MGNDVYSPRDQIEPRYTCRAKLKVMEILKLLPVTNCRACSNATCMVYGAALPAAEITLIDYSPVWQEIYGEKRKTDLPGEFRLALAG